MNGISRRSGGAAEDHHDVEVRPQTPLAPRPASEKRHPDQLVTETLGQRRGEVAGDIVGEARMHGI
jgi:hypothetical protein